MNIYKIKDQLRKDYRDFINVFSEPDPYIDLKDTTPPIIDLDAQSKKVQKILATGPEFARKYKLVIAGRFEKTEEACQSGDGSSLICSRVIKPGEIIVTRDWGEGIYASLRKLFSKKPDDSE